MCNSRSSVLSWNKGRRFRLDRCMRPIIQDLKRHGYRTVACCCGHGRYPMTIVCWRKNGRYNEFLSGKDIPRKKRFYFRDKSGLFFIPECCRR